MSNILQKLRDFVGLDRTNLKQEINEGEIPKNKNIFAILRDFVGLNELDYEFDEDTINESSDNYFRTQQQVNKIEADIECLKHQLNVIENKIDVIIAAIEQNRY